MKTLLFARHLFMALGMVMVLCLPFRQARAQCADQATIYALSTSIPYCAAAPCSGQTITFPMGCTDITGFTFEAIGGISVDLTTASTDGNGNFSVEVKPSPGNICKGRLVMRYNTLADNPCNIPGQYPALNMRFLDVYKQIPTSALSAIYAVKPNTTTPLGSPFHIQTETPPCVAQDERFNLSIYPVFESCLHDGIGLDEIVWGAPPDVGFTEVFKTEEGSSVTFRAPNANLPLTNEFSVFVGKYNAGLLGNPASANATVTLNRGIGRPAILAYSPNGVFNYLAQGNTENVAQACLPINRGGADPGSQGDRFTLQCVPDEQAAASYTWNIPSQFFLVNPSTVNDRVITVEARNRTGSEQGASGVFTCRVQATQSACGEDYAVMIIGRGLVAEEDGQPYNRITVNPMPTQGPNGLNCFSPSQNKEYTFTLEKAPINTLLQWNHTYATPPQNPTESYWLITGQPSQSQIRLRPVVVGTDLSIPLSVQAAGPCSSEVIEYKVGNEDPQVAGTSLEFRFALNDAFNAVALEGRDPNAQNPTWDINWPEFIGGSGCQAGDYHFSWSFTGGNLISSVSSANGLNPLPVNNGTYSGTLRVVVKSIDDTPGCTGSRCFFLDHSETYTNQHFRQAVSGGEPSVPTPTDGVAERQASMALVPNPASGVVSVNVEGIQPKGVLRILSNLQVTVRQQEAFTPGSPVSLKGLPAGIYTVDYRSPDGQRVSKRLSVE